MISAMIATAISDGETAPMASPIGAVSPSEIAVSIMAEITAQLRLPPKEKEEAA